MPENTPYHDLKEAIKILEQEQAVKGQLLKDQFKASYESLNPLNLIKNSLSNFIGSPETRNSLFSLVIPLITRLFSKRKIARTGRGQVFQMAGILILDGLNRYLSQHPEIIANISRFISKVGHTKKNKVKNQEEG